MSILLREPWTVERFLAWEERQEGRHEFDGTHIFPVTGGSRAHQRIVMNLMRLLEARLDPARFDAVQEMRLDIGGRIRYPDVTVCAGRIANDVRTLQDAVVIFEVLSDDTAELDRTDKRREYMSLPGLRHYVLLEQSRVAAVVFARVADEGPVVWSGGDFVFESLGTVLPLSAMYAGLGF